MIIKPDQASYSEAPAVTESAFLLSENFFWEWLLRNLFCLLKRKKMWGYLLFFSNFSYKLYSAMAKIQFCNCCNRFLRHHLFLLSGFTRLTGWQLISHRESAVTRASKLSPDTFLNSHATRCPMKHPWYCTQFCPSECQRWQWKMVHSRYRFHLSPCHRCHRPRLPRRPKRRRLR